ncbi:hypothetical protein OOU_Y34scaffold00649g28 [Pyricularia oryzae Y34]|uniref:Uncharacterized protein n=2 Tax=Pyricularia oryzae TaxID=318829 RepID=A0AA97NUN0_PYRO3|nr:hypothetical protein OOU_Y34scaffold00649g28 [Pyricularia oryzae Y34]
MGLLQLDTASQASGLKSSPLSRIQQPKNLPQLLAVANTHPSPPSEAIFHQRAYFRNRKDKG